MTLEILMLSVFDDFLITLHFLIASVTVGKHDSSSESTHKAWFLVQWIWGVNPNWRRCLGPQLISQFSL